MQLSIAPKSIKGVNAHSINALFISSSYFAVSNSTPNNHLERILSNNFLIDTECLRELV